MRRFAIALAFAALTSASPALAQSYKVIVHPSNPTAQMDAREVSNLFLKKTTRWAHGGVVLPVDLPERNGVRAAFSTAVHGQSVSAVARYWQERVFSGRAVKPSEKSDDAAVVAFVEKFPGAIGYVSASAPTGTAKVLVVR